MPETFGTAQRPWLTQGKDMGGSFVAITTYDDVLYPTTTANPYAYSATQPQTDLATGLFVVGSSAEPLAVSNTLALAFFGAPSTDPDPVKEVRARIWAFSEASHQTFPPEAWLGVLLADITIKFGTTSIPHDSGVFPGGVSGNPYLFACDVIVTTDRSLTPPACRVVGPDSTQGMCVLLFDSIGSASVGIQLTRDRGTGEPGMLNCGVTARSM